jgi:tetratricopeptide (TPR) repeat protein
LVTPTFDFADCERYLPEPLKTELPRFNAVNIPHNYFESAMERLRGRFLRPTNLALALIPQTDRTDVERKMQKVAAEPPVTREQLGASGYFEQGMKAREVGDLESAIFNFTEAIRLRSRYANGYYFRGFSRADKGDYEGAIADFSETIQIDPNYTFAYLQRGLAYFKLGNRDAAIEDLTMGVKHNPQSASGFYSRGYAMHLLGKHDAAIADFSKAIRLSPQDWIYHYSCGLARIAKGDQSGAVNDYITALKLNPDDTIVISEMQTHIEQNEKPKRKWPR